MRQGSKEKIGGKNRIGGVQIRSVSAGVTGRGLIKSLKLAKVRLIG